MACESEVALSDNVLAVARPQKVKSFGDAIAEVRKHSRPYTLDAAEAAMEAVGGAEAFGKMIGDDLKRIRGDHLDDALKEMHEPDFDLVRKMYSLLVQLNAGRDALVTDNTDPLDDLTKDQMMGIASEAAIVRLRVDAEFRKQLLVEISEVEPNAVVAAAIDVMDRPRAGVIVVEPGELD